MCPYPLLCIAVVFGRSRSVRGLGAVRNVFLQRGLLVQSGVAHVFIDGVYGHLCDVLGRLTEETVVKTQHKVLSTLGRQPHMASPGIQIGSPELSSN